MGHGSNLVVRRHVQTGRDEGAPIRALLELENPKNVLKTPLVRQYL